MVSAAATAVTSPATSLLVASHLLCLLEVGAVTSEPKADRQDFVLKSEQV